MNKSIWDRGLVLTALVVAIASAGSVWAAWHATGDLHLRISVVTLAPILGAALVSYSLRILRLHYFLSRSNIALSPWDTIVVQAVGFAFSVTPGHLAEVFKLHLIRQYTGVPVAQTAPLLLLERLTEGGGFAILAFAAGLMLPALQARVPAPVLTLLGLGVLLGLAVTRKYWNKRLAELTVKIAASRLWQRWAPHMRNLSRGLDASFTLAHVVGGLVLSAAARFADGLVVLLAARILGMELALATAIFVLAVSGLAGGISLLPAGTGAVETTMVGLLILSGATWSNALAIALVARLFTLWVWVALGLVAILLLHLAPLFARFENGGEI